MADGYTPTEPENQTPNQPTALPSTGKDTAKEASDCSSWPSLSFEPNSGCVRLTPILSWNYSSSLAHSAFWYERTSQALGTKGTLPKGNTFEIVEIPVPEDATGNTVGLPFFVSDLTGKRPTAVSDKSHILLAKVYGSSAIREFDTTFADKLSNQTEYHKTNIFVPNGASGAGGWRETLTTEWTKPSNLDAVPPTLITSQLGFFKLGQDPAYVASTDQAKTFQQNLATEYGCTSGFTLPENASFAITFSPLTPPATSSADSPEGKPYFRVYWGGRYCFQFSNPEAAFCPDTTNQDKKKWVFEPVGGLNLTSGGTKTLITLLFEVIGQAVVITNVSQAGDPDKQGKRPSWAYQDLVNLDIRSGGLTVPSGKIGIGIRNMSISWSYIPVVYPKMGRMSVKNLETNNSLVGLRVNKKADTTRVMGGTVQVHPSITNANLGAFSFDVEIQRENTVDKSPALYSVELISDPISVAITNRPINTRKRLTEVNLQLSLEQQAGTVSLDNRDGMLSDYGGVVGCTIKTGWAGSGSQVAPTTIFQGFMELSSGTKTTNSSNVTFSLMGADRRLRDAIAINLPIYDGWADTEAVQDLLQRAGWMGNTNIEAPQFQLSIPGPNVPPSYMFPLGKSILECIREIATHAGAWAYVDHLGVFNYIQMNQQYGELVETFGEAPQRGRYNEWLALGSGRSSEEVRNAVIVIGMSCADENLTGPVMAIRTDNGSQVGHYLGNTLLPWLRWLVYPDPKINNAGVATKVAEQLWQNNNRLKINATGKVWGHPKLVPWKKILINQEIDHIGNPGGPWRIISANHHLSMNPTEYYCTLEVEWVDPRYSYASWWE